MEATTRSIRVFISYAHESDPAHGETVRELWLLLRECGIDAKLDRTAAERPQDWSLWMLEELREADFVLCIASPAYRRRAEGTEELGTGRGVQWEARLVRDAYYADPVKARQRFLPVLLPGGSAGDIPEFFGRTVGTNYSVTELSPPGIERLLRVLTGQPYEIEPPLGPPTSLPPRPQTRRSSTVSGLGIGTEPRGRQPDGDKFGNLLTSFRAEIKPGGILRLVGNPAHPMEVPLQMVTGALARKASGLAEVVLSGKDTELGSVGRSGPGAFRDAQHLAGWINSRLQRVGTEQPVPILESAGKSDPSASSKAGATVAPDAHTESTNAFQVPVTPTSLTTGVGAEVYRSPLRMGVLTVLGNIPYFCWWMYGIFGLARREGFPRARSYGWMFAPIYGLVIVHRTMGDLQRARDALSGDRSDTNAAGYVVVLLTATLIGLVVGGFLHRFWVYLIVQAAVQAVGTFMAQRTANEMLRGRHPEWQSRGMTMGEISATVTGVVLLTALVAGGI